MSGSSPAEVKVFMGRLCLFVHEIIVATEGNVHPGGGWNEMKMRSTAYLINTAAGETKKRGGGEAMRRVTTMGYRIALEASPFAHTLTGNPRSVQGTTIALTREHIPEDEVEAQFRDMYEELKLRVHAADALPDGTERTQDVPSLPYDDRSRR